MTATTDLRTFACAAPESDELLSFCRDIFVNRRFAPLAGQADLRVGGLQGSDSVSTQHPPLKPLPDPIPLKIQFPIGKHVVPVMEQQDSGVFFITTSVAAFIGFPAHALYCASKGALESLVRCLAVDHAGKVRVVGICPGTIDTPMLAASCEGWDKPVAELYADVARRIPVRRLGQPSDIAQTAAFLLSDDAGYINGTSIVLDGGTMALPPW